MPCTLYQPTDSRHGIVKGLKQINSTNNYEKGRIIDPLSGKVYDAKVRLNSTGKRLSHSVQVLVFQYLGRNQTWIRLD